jgi:hypothetical protein
MKLYPADRFYDDKGTQLPPGNWRGVAIHPTSEVDMVRIGANVLTVGSVVPFGPNADMVRNAPAEWDPGSGDQLLAGQRLVLALYESCDSLVPLGARAPTHRRKVIATASLGAAVGGANLALRLPFSGRKRARITFSRSTNAQDLSLVIIGANWGRLENGLLGVAGKGLLTQKTPETWWNGGGAAPTITVTAAAGELASAVVLVENESFDELVCYVFGPAGGGDAHVEAEADGEADGAL